MNILTIGGSDPSSGAGIQSDVKTITALDTHCFSVITAITSQNTRKFSKVEPVSTKMIKSQLESILSDFQIDAIKIGMVYNSSIIRAIHSKLRTLTIPIILDPVVKSTTGGILMTKSSLSDYKKYLLPLAFAITPNKSEAEILSGIKIRNRKDLLSSAKKIIKFGVKNVVITGNQLTKNRISDFILNNKWHDTISSKKIKKKNHGSGCTFSSAFTVCIISGKNIRESCKFAQKFTVNSIKNAEKLGKGIPITKIKKIDSCKKDLKNAVERFIQIKNSYLLIPEVQTNFVYSKSKPKTINDVIGVSGRIVKVGKRVMVAGDFEYGGSQHVGTAVLTINKKFPTVRSAINIKFNPRFIKKFQKLGYTVSNYDRSKESAKIKKRENSSISWGIKNSIKNISNSPDMIFHKGDVGKEPMILVFGKEPNDVVRKILKIF